MGCTHGKSGISSAEGVRDQREGHVVRSPARYPGPQDPAGGLVYTPRRHPLDTPPALAEGVGGTRDRWHGDAHEIAQSPSVLEQGEAHESQKIDRAFIASHLGHCMRLPD